VTFKVAEVRQGYRGCGGLLRQFGDEQTLVVARGRILHYGFQYLVEFGSGKAKYANKGGKKKGQKPTKPPSRAPSPARDEPTATASPASNSPTSVRA